jgi:carboxypeptidase family protein
MRIFAIAVLVACAPPIHDQLVIHAEAPAPGATLVGTIRDFTGKPLEGATVVARGVFSTTGMDGTFHLDVSPGRWPIVVYYGETSHPFEAVAVAAERETTVAITLGPGPLIDFGSTSTGLTITSDPSR